MEKFGQYCVGHHDRQLDTKGRISLPVSFRPAPGENVYLLEVKVLGVPCLRVLTEEGFQQKLRDIEKMEGATPALRDRARGTLFGMCLETKVNDQGKLTIPKAMAEGHGLELPGSALLVGRGKLFEIYTSTNGEALKAAEERDREDNAQINDVLGLS
ncbi:MAG: division/cell wall cluster transcriptional repressor MraZ [Akkermansiaceae bacterium]